MRVRCYPRRSSVRSLQASFSPLSPGDHLGDYQLLLEIGVGGMGRVWAARPLRGSPDQLVALKTGLGEGSGSPEFERLFLDEARIASQIAHPNACAVHELGRDKGLLFFAMEWCDGATLRDILDGLPDHRLDYEVAVRIVVDICGGLHAAHELTDEDGAPLNVVHRDVSPQNVLVWTTGHVKVADFGVAKARGQLHRPTETGEVKGKLSYMAPEQVTAEQIDRRADIFGIGCVLYEATVGRRPYQGGDALATLYQLLERETIRPSELDPDYPPALERIVLKALERNPSERYANADEMRRALASWLASRRAIVGEGRVAKIVQSSVGDRVEARRRAVAAAIERLDAGRPITTDGRLSPPAETGDPIVRSVPVEESGSLALRARRGDRRLAPWLAAGAAAGVMVVVVLALGPGRNPEKLAARSVEAQPPVEPSSRPQPHPEQVLIVISAQPPSAEVRLDDEQRVANPLVVRAQADGSQHVVVVTAPGFTPRTRRLTFDRDQEVAIRLEPLPSSDAQPKPAGTKPLVVGPRPTTSARAPSTGTKTVRPLDETNPFGDGS